MEKLNKGKKYIKGKQIDQNIILKGKNNFFI